MTKSFIEYFSLLLIKVNGLSLIKQNTRIILISLTLIFFGCSSVHYVNIEKLNKLKNGKKEGVWIEVYNSGQIKSVVNYHNGKRSGIAKDYHKNGILARKATYKNDKLNGMVLIYETNGKLNSKAKYKNGVFVEGTSYQYL